MNWIAFSVIAVIVVVTLVVMAAESRSSSVYYAARRAKNELRDKQERRRTEYTLTCPYCLTFANENTSLWELWDVKEIACGSCAKTFKAYLQTLHGGQIRMYVSRRLWPREGGELDPEYQQLAS